MYLFPFIFCKTKHELAKQIQNKQEIVQNPEKIPKVFKKYKAEHREQRINKHLTFTAKKKYNAIQNKIKLQR